MNSFILDVVETLGAWIAIVPITFIFFMPFKFKVATKAWLGFLSCRSFSDFIKWIKS